MANDESDKIIAQWRAENADDDANHPYDGPDGPDEDGTPPACLVCGDDQAGLLHAFDPAFPPGFHDEAIYEVAAADDDDRIKPTREAVLKVLEEHSGKVLGLVATLMANLGSKQEWSMEDNFYTTESIAELADRVGLPSAGNQSDEDIAFWQKVEEG